MTALQKSRKDDLAALGEHADWATNTLKYSENGKPKEHSAHVNWLANAVKTEPLKPEHKQALAHFASYYDHIPEVKNANLSGKSLGDGINTLKAAERAGQSKKGSGIVPKIGKPIINYDKMEWRNLGAAGSEAHQETCKHCGNTPSLDEHGGKTHERGLVLESKIDDKLNKNHLFFVNNDGYITEAKAVGNKKPNPKFHKQILDLLEHPDIKGFVGGGYLAEQNFSPEDVTDPEQKKRLEQLKINKPDFFSPDKSNLHESLQDHPGLALEVTDKSQYSVDGTYQHADLSDLGGWDLNDKVENKSYLIAGNPNIHQLKDRLYPDQWDMLIRGAPYQLAVNPNLHHVVDKIPPEQFQHLAKLVPSELAKNPNLDKVLEKLPPEQMDAFIRSEPFAIGYGGNFSQLLEKMSPKQFDKIVKQAHGLAANPDLPRILDKLSPAQKDHLAKEAPINLAHHQNFHQILDKLSPKQTKSVISGAMGALAAHPDLHLFVDKMPFSRMAGEVPDSLAENPNLHLLKDKLSPQQISHMLVHGSSSLAANPVLPQMLDKISPQQFQKMVHISPTFLAKNPNLHLLKDKLSPDNIAHLLKNAPADLADNVSIPKEILEPLKEQARKAIQAGNQAAERRDKDQELDGDDELIDEGSDYMGLQANLYKTETIKKIRDPNVDLNYLKKYEFSHNEEVAAEAQKAIKAKGGLKKSSKDQLPGGKGDKKSDKDFRKKEVAMGHKVEAEHTSNPKIAAEVTRDHLSEKPNYYSKLKDAGLADELEKGMSGDWKKEGYTFTHKQNTDDVMALHGMTSHDITAYAPNGEVAGIYSFTHSGPNTHIYPSGSLTHDQHKRKGLATAAYRIIEKKLKDKVMPAIDNSKDAKKLWSQPNRPFGKSDELEKGKPEQYQITPEYTLTKKPWIEAGNYYGKPRDYWELSHNSNPKKPAGKFLIDTETDPTMSHSLVDTKHRNKGLGSTVYKILAGHYGSMSSDQIKTSRSAKRVWEKIGGIPTGEKNLGRQNKQRYKIVSKSNELEKGSTHIPVYHGSDTLPEGSRPDASPSAGVFVTPDKAFAKNFGKKVHSFQVDGRKILDTRKPEHRALIGNKIPLTKLGLPGAMGGSTNPKHLDLLKKIATKNGFVGAYQHESDWGNQIGIEVYHPQHLKKPLQKTQDSYVVTSSSDLQTETGDKLTHNKKIADNLWHQVHKTRSGITHSLISLDQNGNGKRQVLATMDVYHHADEPHPYVAYSQVGHKFKGQGYGKALYIQALKHHGSLRSDTHVSPQANKAWEWLGKQPGVSVKMGAPNTDESHVAVYGGLKKSEGLQKGQNGDWQKEGYTLRHTANPGGHHTVEAVASNGDTAGYAEFSHQKDMVMPLLVDVEKAHRRKGLGSAMYRLIEQKLGARLVNNPIMQSKSAKKMWAQPNRAFGKSGVKQEKIKYSVGYRTDHTKWWNLEDHKKGEEEKGNSFPDISKYPNHEAIWVTHKAKDAKKYGDDIRQVNLTGAVNFLDDGDGGHLYIRPKSNKPLGKPLEKADWHVDKWVPTPKDVGKPHPENKDLVGTIDKYNQPAWTLAKPLAAQKDSELKGLANSYAVAEPSKNLAVKQLTNHLLADPDRHNRNTGSETNAQDYRARHLAAALKGDKGYKIAHGKNGLELHAPRHNKPDAPVHVWDFGNNELKFSHEYPISEQGGEHDNIRGYRRSPQGVAPNDSRGAGNAVGSGSQPARNPGSVLPKDGTTPKGNNPAPAGSVIRRPKT